MVKKADKANMGGKAEKKEESFEERKPTYPVVIPVNQKMKDMMIKHQNIHREANGNFMYFEEQVVNHRIDLAEFEKNANKHYKVLSDAMDTMKGMLENFAEANGYSSEKHVVTFDFNSGNIVISPKGEGPMGPPPRSM